MTDTALKPLPDTKNSITDRARDAAAIGRDKVSSAAAATVGAAKDHPVAAAGIVAGVAAAVGGAAYAATKRDAGTKAAAKKPADKRK